MGFLLYLRLPKEAVRLGLWFCFIAGLYALVSRLGVPQSIERPIFLREDVPADRRDPAVLKKHECKRADGRTAKTALSEINLPCAGNCPALPANDSTGIVSDQGRHENTGRSPDVFNFPESSSLDHGVHACPVYDALREDCG